MGKKVCVIHGYNGAQKVFERTLPIAHLSEQQAEALLQRLAARDLTCDEVVSASLSRRARDRRDDFEIANNGIGPFALMTNGTGRYYTATIRDSE